MTPNYRARLELNVGHRARTRHPSWIIGILCGLVAFLAFLPAIGAELLNLDDDWNLAFNPKFQGLSGRHLYWMFTTSSPMGHYQPLTWLSYGVDFTLFGHRAEGYHRTNVFLHATAAVAFYLLASTLFEVVRGLGPAPQHGRSGRIRAAAALSALLFAVHPLRVESVAWATGRNDLLSGLFAVLATTAWIRHGSRSPCVRWKVADAAAVVGLASGAFALALASIDLSTPGTLRLKGLGSGGLILAIACFGLLLFRILRARQIRRPAQRPFAYVSACLCLLLSFLCKSWAVGLPVVLLILDIWPLGRLDPGNAIGKRLSRRAAFFDLLMEKLPLLVLCGVFAVIANWAKDALPILVKTDQTLAERVGQAVYGLAFYQLKTLWPAGLVVIHDLPDVISLIAPRFLLPAFAVLALTVVLILLRRRAPAAVAAIASFAILVAPVLGLVQFNTLLVADRYSYVACMPFALLAGGAWIEGLDRFPRARVILFSLSLAVVTALFVGTWRQSAVWRTSESLYLHALKFGETSRVLSNLALIYNEKAHQDPSRRTERLDKALALSTRAIELARTSGLHVAQYHLTRGTVLLNRGDLEGAIAELRAFLAEKPDYAQGQINLGLALLRAGRYGEALPHLQRAVQLAGDNADAWRLLGAAFEADGNRPAALQAYRRSFSLQPEHPTTRERLRLLEDAK